MRFEENIVGNILVAKVLDTRIAAAVAPQPAPAMTKSLPLPSFFRLAINAPKPSRAWAFNSSTS